MNIENGIVTGWIVKQDLIFKSNKTSRSQTKMTPKYITVHNTGNANANAKGNTEYVDITTDYVSWHFTVGDIEIYQELPLNEIGWHCGDGVNGIGNTQSIGIEICDNEWYQGHYEKYKKAEDNAIELIIFLMKKFNISIENVVPHQHWSDKYCPHVILDYGWDKFVKRIEDKIKELNKFSKIPEWKTDGIKYLAENGLLNNPQIWLDKLDEPIPVWTTMTLLSRIHKDLKEKG